jgi:hypothetical protein
MSTRKSKYEDEHEEKLQKSLDVFGFRMIKVIGVFGAIIGLAILIAFWFWVIRWLYSK